MGGARLHWGGMRRELAAMHTQVCMTEELPPIPDLLSEEAHDFLALCFIRAPACRPADQTFVFRLGADAWLRNAKLRLPRNSRAA